jgi:hypothetical protein
MNERVMACEDQFVETPELLAALEEAVRQAELEPDVFQTHEEMMAEVDKWLGELP